MQIQNLVTVFLSREGLQDEWTCAQGCYTLRALIFQQRDVHRSAQTYETVGGKLWASTSGTKAYSPITCRTLFHSPSGPE